MRTIIRIDTIDEPGQERLGQYTVIEMVRAIEPFLKQRWPAWDPVVTVVVGVEDSPAEAKELLRQAS